MSKSHNGETALDIYGAYGVINAEMKKQCLEELRVLFAEGPHPSQVQRRRDVIWARRWPFMFVVVSCASGRCPSNSWRGCLWSRCPSSRGASTACRLLSLAKQPCLVLRCAVSSSTAGDASVDSNPRRNLGQRCWLLVPPKASLS